MDQDYSIMATVNQSYIFDGTYGPIPDENGFVDLTDYAKNYIANYEDVTVIPKANMEYLNHCTPTNMTRAFAGLIKVPTIDVSGIDTSHVTSFNHCFDMEAPDNKSDDGVLNNIVGIENLNTSSATDLSYMFHYCVKLTNVDCNKWDVSKVTTTGGMFYRCGLENFYAPDWNTVSLNSTDSMFSGCNSIDTIDVSNWKTDKLTNLNNMFAGFFAGGYEYVCSAKTINLFIINNIPGRTISLYYTFSFTTQLSNIDLSRWDTTNVTDTRYLFYYSNLYPKTGIETWNTHNVDAATGMFMSARVSSDEIQNFDTSNITDMQAMFEQATIEGELLDLSKWNTSKVTNMVQMFAYINIASSTGITLDLSNFDTSNVTDMSNMFAGDYDINTINRINDVRLTLDMKSSRDDDFEQYGSMLNALAPYMKIYSGSPISIKNVPDSYYEKNYTASSSYFDENEGNRIEVSITFENRFTYRTCYSMSDIVEQYHNGEIKDLKCDGVVYKVI